MSLKFPQVDPARLEAEWDADKDVLVQLAANGDRAKQPRPVDVSFRGTEENFERVLNVASQFGFVELDREVGEDGEHYLFLECESAVDEDSIRAITRKCIQIEMMFDVEYDGWGCEAQTGAVH
ncbi:MAG: ribonuclease E inhibitor RraB [Alphaproteobacteria bacterium]|nr:ribonuclease E inhibitor RraB [Alphaproteobacteria bacterium]MBU0792673.1 ribonuclease E inhibitor RraB [Alphaproteobacteria bacterium]MBU0877333.1 ribonuclease E inhibitor RraB [Alphaproteobacteria bacterium]MBU1770491.1 ribonuclease E inhibitor RraB [Alphaproteobacteria bacterium]